MAQYQHSYLDLGENINTASNEDLEFWHFVLFNQKLKKQKWQCSQNLDFNPTFVIADLFWISHEIVRLGRLGVNSTRNIYDFEIEYLLEIPILLLKDLSNS